MSASLRLSRASTRTSLASDDLDRYMTGAEAAQFGGSLGSIEHANPLLPNGFLGQNSASLNGGLASKPLVQPRVVTSNTAGGQRMLSGGRSHDNFMQSAASYDAPSVHVPPPVKPRKASSVASLNNSLNESSRQLNSYYSNENSKSPCGNRF